MSAVWMRFASIAFAALAVGIPAGVGAGRWAWSEFATQLGTVAVPAGGANTPRARTQARVVLP